MIGTTIAIRYSSQRPQFGDKLIMDYLSHQRRLLPGLAATYALQLGLKQLKVHRVCVCVVFGGWGAICEISAFDGLFVFLVWCAMASAYCFFLNLLTSFSLCLLRLFLHFPYYTAAIYPSQQQNIAFAAQPDAKQVHVLSSGLKAAATWTRVEVLQNCRCGMHVAVLLGCLD